jgi:hypothetical protein
MKSWPPLQQLSPCSCPRTIEQSCVVPTAVKVNSVIRGSGCGAWKIWAESNADYKVAEFAPGFAVFGSNGGGEPYAWDLRESRRSNYVVIPFIFDQEVAVPVGDTFEEFLSILHGGSPFEGRPGT